MRSLTRATNRLPIATAVAVPMLSPVANAGSPAPKPRQVPLVVRVDEGGFQWADAGIGAAAGFGAALVLAGGLALAGRKDRA
jgi:hypothetical protein